MASDFQSAVIRQSMLVQEEWRYEAGTLAVPSGAGIGVTLDKEALRHYLQAEAEYRL
jgi:L-alanine-DL-glutamate epimerase-like enolase superfamily enzyme